MNYGDTSPNIYPAKVYSLAGNGSDLAAFESTRRKLIPHGENSVRNLYSRPVSWNSASVLRNNKANIRSEWKHGKKQVVFFPWTPKDGVAFEFEKCRCAECIRRGTETDYGRSTVERNVAGTLEAQGRDFFSAVEANRAVLTESRFPSHNGDGYNPVSSCYDPHSQTYTNYERDYGHSGRHREINGRGLMTHFSKPAKTTGFAPGQTSRHLLHVARDPKVPNSTRRDYAIKPSPFSLNARADTNGRIVEDEGISFRNEITSLMEDTEVFYGARHIPTPRQEARPNVAARDALSYVTRGIRDPSIPARARHYQSEFFDNGLPLNSGFQVRNESETKETLEKEDVQNLAVLSDFQQSGLHNAAHARLERWIGAKNRSSPTNALVPLTADVCCNGTDDYQQVHRSNQNESLTMEGDTNRQREIPKADLRTERVCRKRYQFEGTKRYCRPTAKARCVGSGQEPALSQRTTHISSDARVFLPSSPVEAAPPEDEFASREVFGFEGTSNSRRAGESLDQNLDEAESQMLHESCAREERIRNLKMLQTEQEKALDKLLLEKSICLEFGLTSDVKNAGKRRGKVKGGNDVPLQKPANYVWSKNWEHFPSKETDVLDVTEEKTRPTDSHKSPGKSSSKYKAPKKRWLKIWKTRGRISDQNAKKEMTRVGIQKKNALKMDDNQDLSSDEYSALMGLVNLSKS